MANKMLIDTTHPEETRVVVLRGNRVEEFDFESANRRQLRGNIYLAKVTRVEPSLQAAFVDYGGNRHGFLAFSEIHPDYYQIPVADRQALIADEERAHREAEEEVDRRASGGGRGRRPRREHSRRDPVRTQPFEDSNEGAPAEGAEGVAPVTDESGTADHADTHQAEAQDTEHVAAPEAHAEHVEPAREAEAPPVEQQAEATQTEPAAAHEQAPVADPTSDAALQTAPEPTESSLATESPDLAPEAPHGDESAGNGNGNVTEVEEPAAAENGEEEEVVESVGGADAMEEAQERTPPRYRRNYKIQEVIKRRQIMLVQVVKEERGTKGAALTTYLSLAGRYSVLMPNTARGGGISRKITNSIDRKKLKEIAQDLEVPEGMGVILRTAGASRTKTEVKRDFEYLLRLWETVRDFTLRSTAPTLVYEEGSLIKRSIRDLYNKDIEEILVAGEAGHREAKDFMRMLMPSHAKNVKLYVDPQPVFTRYGIESQLDAMFSSTVQLRSGGYIVLNQTEALVAIDVNSGRATREHHIEDTALKTNLEASEEVARQLRLRDLAGLIVIDFIDMDEGRNNRLVERRLKESLKNDRARIQVGRISHFGLMEMSRQRIRSSVLESSTDKCPHCGGSGHVRSVSSVALHLLRMLEEMLLKGATHNLLVRTRTEVALYCLNHKRAHLRDLESRFQITITVNADATIGAAQPFLIEKGELVHSIEAAKAIAAQAPAAAPVVEDEYEDEVDEFAEEEAPEETEGEAETSEHVPDSASADAEARDDSQRRGRRRRRGRGGREGGREPREGGREPREGGREPREGAFSHEIVAEHAIAHEGNGGEPAEAAGEIHSDRGPAGVPGQNGDGEHRRRRRGRRGGRRNRRGREGEPGFAGPNGGHGEHQEHQGVEPEVADAVADLGGASRAEAPSAPEPQAPQPFEPVARETPRDTAPEPAPQEPPRRRSTIREPAPVFSSGPMSDVQPSAPPPPLPEPGPAVTIPEPAAPSSEAEAKPRRFGWWNRRG
ncbi:MAG: ribonuclease [Hyphomicrobiales bacterium]|jgi:ribonuclease E|nr:ribonuclease [Hyphomicrobiales bacterium]